jgi:hypothetical protein
MHSYIRLEAVCPAYREALDAYERVMNGEPEVAAETSAEPKVITPTGHE